MTIEFLKLGFTSALSDRVLLATFHARFWFNLTIKTYDLLWKSCFYCAV